MLDIDRTDDPRGLRLAGEIDMSNADELAKALEEASNRGGEVVLDVSGLHFVDSAGVQVLIKTALGLEGRGSLILVQPGEQLRRLVQIMGLDRIPNIEVRG